MSKPQENFEVIDNEFILIKFENLEDISFKNNSNVDSRKPHIAFYNLLDSIRKNITIKYYKLIDNGLEFYISTRSTSQFCKNDILNSVESLSPFQEQDTQCQELRKHTKISKKFQ